MQLSKKLLIAVTLGNFQLGAEKEVNEVQPENKHDSEIAEEIFQSDISIVFSELQPRKTLDRYTASAVDRFDKFSIVVRLDKSKQMYSGYRGEIISKKFTVVILAL